MNADAFAASPEVLADGLTERLMRQFRVGAEDWLDVCRKLSEWEDRRLVDDLNPEALAQHAKVIRNLEWLGGLIAMVTQDDQFNDRQFAQMVAATLQDLRDRRALWHGSMSGEQREQLLREVFPS